MQVVTRFAAIAGILASSSIVVLFAFYGLVLVIAHQGMPFPGRFQADEFPIGFDTWSGRYYTVGENGSWFDQPKTGQ